MAKKKKHKKSGKQFNPHKLGGKQLMDEITHQLTLGKVDQAFALVKVLLDKQNSVENRDLFKSVIDEKIRRMEEKGQVNEIAGIIAEAKKRFDANLFSEVENSIKIRLLADAQLVAHFTEKEAIPESFHSRIADYLFFSTAKEKEFIQKHKAFKDLFYVKEAFKNGFEPEITKKMLAGISSKSPFKHWLLLRKAIEAFSEDDDTMLEVLSKKCREASFPKFMIGKLFECQTYLQGKVDGIALLSKTDLEIFRTVCGEGFLKTCVFNRAQNLFKQGNFDKVLQFLNISKIVLQTEESNHLFILFFSRLIKHYTYSKVLQNRKKLGNLPEIAPFFLNREHLFLKLLTLESLPPYERREIVDQISKSSALTACTLFKPEILKGELLFRLAKSMADHHPLPKNPFSFLNNRFLDEDDDDPDDDYDIYPILTLLEESLKLSHHNPEVFIFLINKYISRNEKTSTINGVVKKLLENFPENTEGYKLAGDIAYRNNTYAKALGFYEKAYHLMPLNREFPLTILKCYEKLSETRKIATVHLIEKDLENAKQFVNPANLRAVENYDLLQTKAYFKITVLDPSTVEKHYPVIAAFSERFMDSSQQLFRYLMIFDGTSLGENFFNRHLSQVMDHLIDLLDSKGFSTFLSDYLNTESRQNGNRFIFNKALLGLFEKEKKNPSASFGEIANWLHLCLENGQHALFISLIYYGKCAVPHDPVINFLLEISRKKINSKMVRKWLLDEGTIAWFQTKSGLKMLDFLSDHHYLFDDLLEIFEMSELSEIADEIRDLLDDRSVSFSRFRKWFLEMNDKDDCTPLVAVEKLFRSVDGLKDISSGNVNPPRIKDMSKPIPEKPVKDSIEKGAQM
ncbi:MAG: hypothetical protein HQ517_12305, partial [SAR324 cluster bacterium]|nr:hypothetical protein [SAR324 cluster bacterium]